MTDFPKSFLAKLTAVEAKRPKTVIQHILQHGHVTSQELKEIYGYNHPPRAIRDVREHGIPIITYRISGTDGRSIAAYTFGDPATAQNISKVAGRTVLSKTLKQCLINKYGSRCCIYGESVDANILQVDHRIPYEIGGEQQEVMFDAYMLLSPSANRAKSWTCEHCNNWRTKDADFCSRCFFAHPENYDHVAGKRQKILHIVFTGDESTDYTTLIESVGIQEASTTMKQLLREHITHLTRKT